MTCCVWKLTDQAIHWPAGASHRHPPPRARRCPSYPSYWLKWCVFWAPPHWSLHQIAPDPPGQAEPGWALPEAWEFHSSYLTEKRMEEQRKTEINKLYMVCHTNQLIVSKYRTTAHKTGELEIFMSPSSSAWFFTSCSVIPWYLQHTAVMKSPTLKSLHLELTSKSLHWSLITALIFFSQLVIFFPDEKKKKQTLCYGW